MPPKKRTSGRTPPTPPAPKRSRAGGRKQRAHVITDVPERGRATKGPRTAPERGRQTTAARGRPPTVPGAAGRAGGPTPVVVVGRSQPEKDRLGVLSRVAKPKEGATYHRAVLAEFVGAMVLAVIGSILSPRKRADGQPTWVHLIVQVTAIAGVFFILALLSASPRLGKISAAFGLLVFLGVLLNSADAVRKMAAVFAPAQKQAPAPGAGMSQPSGTTAGG